jgi:hypothetical protein
VDAHMLQQHRVLLRHPRPFAHRLAGVPPAAPPACSAGGCSRHCLDDQPIERKTDADACE